MKIFEFINEGVNDPAIFKAVFVIGGPGSGKSTVSEMLALPALGLVNINSDLALAYLMQKNQLDFAMPPEEREKREVVRSRAKEITSTKMNNAIDGRLGIFIDGTGEDYSKIESLNSNLQEIGYSTFLVVVNAPLDIAKQRNQKRLRKVPEDILEKKWYGVQKNLKRFLEIFPQHVIINNDGPLETVEPSIHHAYKKLVKFTNGPITSDIAQLWIDKQKQKEINESLTDKNIQQLLKAKQVIQQKNQEELAAWKRDVEKNYPSLFQKIEKPTTFDPFKPDIQPVQQEPEVHEPSKVLQQKLDMLNLAIEKYKTLEKLKQKVEYKGLLNSALKSDTDVTLYINKDAYKDGYKGLNDKLDKSIALLQNRLKINKLAFRESIDLEKSFPIETWYEDDNTYADVAVAHDSEGRDIEIIFTPLHDEINAVDFDFTRGGTYEKTGEGEAGKVFATVLNAFNEYLHQINDPDYILFASKGGSRTSAYQALIRRFAHKFGYKVIPYHELPDEIADQPQAEGHQFVLAKV